MGEAAGSMAATIGDCNGDGIEDVLVTRLGYGSLYMGTTNGIFEDRMMASGLGSLTAQLSAGADVFSTLIIPASSTFSSRTATRITSSAGKVCCWKIAATVRSWTRRRKAAPISKPKFRARGSAVADYDNDGRMDVVVTTIGDRPFLLHNRDKSGNRWLTLDLEGSKSNRDGYGAKAKLTAGGKTFFAESRCAFGFLMQSDLFPSENA
jgi:enediyne biosynthesis protein E4